ncbi:MAG: GDP-L-fucose synthase [Desulfohalobiaceae bacterium]|nr:GDP-L-fucose synthase [Desulfohalobiaceae bacterium]
MTSTIFVAGGSGMVGRAIIRRLHGKGHDNVIANYHRRRPGLEGVRWHGLDLTDQRAVAQFFQEQKPDYVFLAAARVGGIGANNLYRTDFLLDNLQIQNNIIQAGWQHGVSKLLFLGSSCIYPRECPQPIREEYLLTDTLEFTNEPYAVAKIAGLKLCESFNLQHNTNFVSVMPTNLFGPGDNFDLLSSHVLPALIRKFHLGKCLESNDWEALRADLSERPIADIDGTASADAILQALSTHGITSSAPTTDHRPPTFDVRPPTSDVRPPTTVTLWGSGSPRREFLHVDDLAEACVFVMENVDFDDLVTLRRQELGEDCPEAENIRNTHVNIGRGQDLGIKELAELIRSIVGYKGRTVWDDSRPDGTPRKLLDVSRLKFLGWKPRIELQEGIEATYKWYLACQAREGGKV